MKVNKERRSFGASKARGFTLLEMVIVLGIIALILAAAIGMGGNFMGLGREVTTKAKMKTITAALETYRIKFKRYPDELSDLVEKPSRGAPKGWKAQMDVLPKDGWDRDFRYLRDSEKKPGSPEVISDGPDLNDKSDDISSLDIE